MNVSTQFFHFDRPDAPLRLHAGAQLPQFTLAYETYGTLNAKRDNAILLFHAMTGSHHAAGFNGDVAGVGDRWMPEMHDGWWDGFIGPGLALDTDKFFVICANYLGGCYGSTGPTSPKSDGEIWGADFPAIRLADIVDSQLELVKSLDVETLHAAVGASIGGLLALSLATRHPQRVRNVVPIATGVETSITTRLLNFEQINAIEIDPKFRGGAYDLDDPPVEGLALARRIAHKTFRSLGSLKADSLEVNISNAPPFGWYEMNASVESYMLYQGEKFVARFDANSYLRILDAWQWFDIAREGRASNVSDLFLRCREQKFLVFSIDSDLSFPPAQQGRLVEILEDAGVETVWITVHSGKGHDSFLLEPKLYAPHLRALLMGE